MAEYRMKADLTFEADHLDEALVKLAYHFLNKGIGPGDSDLPTSGKLEVGLADSKEWASRS